MKWFALGLTLGVWGACVAVNKLRDDHPVMVYNFEAK